MASHLPGRWKQTVALVVWLGVATLLGGVLLIRHLVALPTPDASDLKRVAAGKPEAGTITIETRLDAESFRVEIADDGAGIDWDRVAVKARALGLRTDTLRDLEEALFATNLSTADTATEVSGRGVGMGALRMTCIGLGGRVELVSAGGRGTRVACVLPRSRDRFEARQVA